MTKSLRAGPGDVPLFELPSDPGETPKLFSLDELVALASEPEPSLAVGGAGLFVEGLTLGPAFLDPEDETAIVEHLVAVAKARQVPLHTAVAWNALYFGFDPDAGRYEADEAVSAMVTLVLGATAEAVPVGAFVTVSVS